MNFHHRCLTYKMVDFSRIRNHKSRYSVLKQRRRLPAGLWIREDLIPEVRAERREKYLKDSLALLEAKGLNARLEDGGIFIDGKPVSHGELRRLRLPTTSPRATGRDSPIPTINFRIGSEVNPSTPALRGGSASLSSGPVGVVAREEQNATRFLHQKKLSEEAAKNVETVNITTNTTVKERKTKTNPKLPPVVNKNLEIVSVKTRSSTKSSSPTAHSSVTATPMAAWLNSQPIGSSGDNSGGQECEQELKESKKAASKN